MQLESFVWIIMNVSHVSEGLALKQRMQPIVVHYLTLSFKVSEGLALKQRMQLVMKELLTAGDSVSEGLALKQRMQHH